MPDGRVCDVAINGGVIAEIGPRLDAHHDTVVDLTGHLLTVSFVEPHAHLDKAFLADRIHNPVGDLMGAIEGLDAVRDTITHSDTVDRATAAARLLSRNGVTHVRTHADTTLANGLLSVEALLETKQRCSSFIDIQVAMLLEWPLTGAASADRRLLAREAVSAGIDVIGGCPHLDDDPRGAVEYLLELALEHGLPLDLHADENLRPDSSDLEHLADMMLSSGVNHRVNASHCVSLSTRSSADINRIADKTAQCGISVTALPQTNLFLQARGMATQVPRGIAPVNILRAAGVTVAAGADNLQDPFNPMGRADPLEIASLLVTAAHVPVGDAFDMVTRDSHIVVRNAEPSVSVGERANLVAIPATTIRESLAMGPADRIVIRDGLVVTDETRNRK